MELVLATNNFDKVKEMKKILRGPRIKILTLRDFPPMKEVNENGRTLRDNAIKKARAAAGKTKTLVLADDSGLEVRALGGKPGVRSSRFAGPGCSYSDNNRKLLRLMKKIPERKRQAKFACVIAVLMPGTKIKTVKGICKGKIALKIQGRQGFGYDPVFIPEGYSKTFAELGLGVKNRISHRSKALVKARKVLLQLAG